MVNSVGWGLSKRVNAGRGEGEYLGLAVVGVAKRKSEEMLAHPGREEAGGDDGFVDAPRCDVVQWESLGQMQGEQVHQRVAGRTYLHPEFEHAARLLSEVVGAPPPFEVLK